MQWISLILEVALLVIGAFLGEVYGNTLYVYWLVVVGGLIIFTQMLISTLIKTKGQLENYKAKVSAFSTLKENVNSAFQITVFPSKKIVSGQEVKIELFLTSLYSIENKLYIKLITDNQWDITISNQSQLGNLYAGKYEYVLFNPSFDILENMFFRTSFYVKFEKPGRYNFMIECNNGSTQGSLNSSLIVHKS